MRNLTIPIPNAIVIRGAFLRIAGLLVLAYLAYLAYLVREIWVPLGLAFLLAMILDPVVDRMEVRGWTRQAASAFIFGSFLLIAGGLLVLAYPYGAAQIEALQKGFDRYFPDPSHAGLLRSFHHMGMTQTLANAGVEIIEKGRASISRSSNWITDYGMPLVANALWIVIVPIVAFYTLRDFHIILAKALLLIPPRRRDLVQTAVTEITAVFGRYLRGLAIVSILNGVATAILLTLLGVPGALLVGIVAGLLYSVPYVGAMLTIVVTGAIAFVGGGPSLLLTSIAASLVLHQLVFDQIVSPRVLGAHVGLHPILSIVALLMGNLLLGIIGMILAVPVAACIQIAVVALIPKLSQEIDISRPVSETVDSQESLERETTESHVKIDATEELHTAISNAVQSIDESIKNSPEEEPGDLDELKLEPVTDYSKS